MMTRLRNEVSLTEAIKLGGYVIALTVIVVTMRSGIASNREISARMQVGLTDHEERITDIETLEREKKIFQDGLEAGRAEAPDG